MMHYTKTHEWVEKVGDLFRVGITDWAQKELGDIVFIELPHVGDALKAGDVLCIIETTKAAADITCPIHGVVRAVNTDLVENPGLINASAEDLAWIAVIDGEPAELLDAIDYAQLMHRP